MKFKSIVVILLSLIVLATVIILFSNGCFEASVPFSSGSRDTVKAYVEANKELVDKAGNSGMTYGKQNTVSLRDSELTIQGKGNIKLQRFDSGNEPESPRIISSTDLSEVLKNCQKALVNNETAVFQMGSKRFGSTTWGFYYCDDDKPHGLHLCGDQELVADGEGWSFTDFEHVGCYIYVERLEPQVFFFYKVY